MSSKLLIWGTMFLIIGVFIFPIIYMIFSMWWLVTGDMVTRTTFFITGLISTLSATILLLGIPTINKLKKLFKL